ncbi:MAG TPA: peptidoglycan recognition family protein, partial [Acidimicrobiales bacterium]|nr:peptidoglycan recognition family protein [Acidimicrobiales bacterium]
MLRFRQFAIACAIAMLAIAGLIAQAGSAEPHRLPRTLADTRPAGAGIVEPAFAVEFVAATWPGEEAPGAAVRFRHGGAWGGWVAFAEDGAQAPGQFSTNLVTADRADAYQVRGVPAGARVSAINTTDGPLETVGTKPAHSAGAFANACRSRADWGADESLMTWAPAFYPTQVLTLHHTVTSNHDTDPAATVRAIYFQHAVTNGWGDIGYQYIVDQQGVVYEGRYSGHTSRSCLYGGGDGSDFAHTLDGSDYGVTGAHVSGQNSGNLGIALLGTYTSVAPPGAQRSSVVDVLARLATRHGIDPLQMSYHFVNPVSGATATVPAISGHRDWMATACPGDTFYADLPNVRTDVAASMSGGGTTTTTSTSTTTTSTSTTSTTIKRGKGGSGGPKGKPWLRLGAPSFGTERA